MPEAGREQFPEKDFKQLLRAGVKYREIGNFEAAFYYLQLARDAALEDPGATDKQVAKIFRELGETYALPIEKPHILQLDDETRRQYAENAIECLLAALDFYSK